MPTNWAPFDILAGPADVYVAATGTSFPTVSGSVSAWTALGKTEGGVTVRHTQNVEMLSSDQDTGPLKALRTEEGLEVQCNLVSLTLENYAKVMNSATVTAAAGPPATKEIPLYRDVNVGLFALLIRGRSPYGNFNSQYQIPVVCQTDEPEIEHVKDDKSILACTWTALVDPNAATTSDRFGKLIAQTS